MSYDQLGTELRGIKKPYYVLVDGKQNEKPLYSQLEDAVKAKSAAQLKEIKEADREQRATFNIRILFCQFDKTGFVSE